MTEVCKIYRSALDLFEKGIRVVSVDEKSGIQALERTEPDKPMQAGSPVKIEYEYERHGTTCLFGNFEVATGKILTPTLSPTRTSDDFVAHIKSTLQLDPEGEWVFVLDQLNTHKSEALVRFVANKIGFEGDLGVARKHGILENMRTRKQFLSDSSHRIRFIYTPKHTSWLNQIEVWFSILQRKALKYLSVPSLLALQQRIMSFIKYYNAHGSKPFKWTYEGKLCEV